ncbi:hypothetical protein BS78_05G060000 [Paspalum vaginatum]|nr:hypothetical protein BS78_05G060000 [Paspalum vaginatum]
MSGGAATSWQRWGRSGLSRRAGCIVRTFPKSNRNQATHPTQSRLQFAFLRIIFVCLPGWRPATRLGTKGGGARPGAARTHLGAAKNQNHGTIKPTDSVPTNAKEEEEEGRLLPAGCRIQ